MARQRKDFEGGGTPMPACQSREAKLNGDVLNLLFRLGLA